MKKIFFIFSLLSLLLVVSACASKPMMDQLDERGFYPYSNNELGFSLPLTKEFQYYQTQRIDKPDFKELDIFVPTADTNIPEIVPGYAEPIIVRAYDKNFYNGLSEADRNELVKVGEKGSKIYALKFWDIIPADWKDKWTEAMKQQLIGNFKLK